MGRPGGADGREPLRPRLVRLGCRASRAAAPGTLLGQAHSLSLCQPYPHSLTGCCLARLSTRLARLVLSLHPETGRRSQEELMGPRAAGRAHMRTPGSHQPGQDSWEWAVRQGLASDPLAWAPHSTLPFLAWGQDPLSSVAGVLPSLLLSNLDLTTMIVVHLSLDKVTKPILCHSMAHSPGPATQHREKDSETQGCPQGRGDIMAR